MRRRENDKHVNVIYLFPGQGAPEGIWGDGLTDPGQPVPEVAGISSEVFNTIDRIVQEIAPGFPSVSEINRMLEREKIRPSYTHIGTAATGLAIVRSFEHLAAEEGIYILRKGGAGQSVGQSINVAVAGWLPEDAAIANVVYRGINLDLQTDENLIGIYEDGHFSRGVFPYAMCALVGTREGPLEEVAGSAGAYITNVNHQTVHVIGGTDGSIADTIAELEERKYDLHRVMPLKVGAVFHSLLVEDAAHAYGEQLAGLLSSPKVREHLEMAESDPNAPFVVSDMKGSELLKPSEFYDYAVAQVYNQVRFGDAAIRTAELAAAHGAKIIAIGPNESATSALRSSFRGLELNGRPAQREIIPVHDRETLYEAVERLAA